MGIWDFFSNNRQLDPDEAVIMQLQKAGSNLLKPHKIEFFIYFPSQFSAEEAGNRIRNSGFQVEVSKSEGGENWLCFSRNQWFLNHRNCRVFGRILKNLLIRWGENMTVGGQKL